MPILDQKAQYFMRLALQEAQLAADEGEVPVGAVVVCQDRVIGKGHNQVERLQDVTAHAEMIAITSASAYLGSKYLQECSIYVSLEPCPMCASAIRWAQLEELVWAASDDKFGFRRLSDDLIHPKTSCTHGLFADESEEMLKQFFAQLRSDQSG